jgi:hypothetical protein
MTYVNKPKAPVTSDQQYEQKAWQVGGNGEEHWRVE